MQSMLVHAEYGISKNNRPLFHCGTKKYCSPCIPTLFLLFYVGNVYSSGICSSCAVPLLESVMHKISSLAVLHLAFLYASVSCIVRSTHLPDLNGEFLDPSFLIMGRTWTL